MRTELCLQVPGQCMTLMFALLTVYDGKYIQPYVRFTASI